MKINREEWIEKLMRLGFTQVPPVGKHGKKNPIYINSMAGGNVFVVEPYHPEFKSWSDIVRHIEAQ